jgi:hypothetical protein
MRRSIALAACLLAGSLVPAAAAQTPTLAPLKGCYVTAGPEVEQRERVDITAQGLTKNGTATVAVDGTVIEPHAAIDPAGVLAGAVQAPFQAQGQRLFTLTITDNTNPGLAVSAQSLVTALDVQVTPANARPSRRVRFRGRGFTGGPAVYAHYVRKGKLRKTVQLATAAGPCGTFDVRRRQLPVKRPQTGRWMVQIDQDRTWRKAPASVSVQLTIDVTRSPGPTSRSSFPSLRLGLVGRRDAR